MASIMTANDRVKPRKSGGQFSIVARELRRNRGALIGLFLLMLLLVIAIAAPLIAPYDPIKIVSADSLLAPSRVHLMGTDKFGRDIFSRVLYGTRISLFVGLISVSIGFGVGVPVGLAVGWFGGFFSGVMMRITDAMLALPGILLALTIVAALGPSLINAMIAVGISSIPTYVRLMRGGVLSAKENIYVDAARVSGASALRIMFRHVLPNVVAPVIVVASLGIASAILAASGLSFLGLGAQPPTPEWGASVSDGRDLLQIAWWISTFPSLAIMVAVLAINLLGDGLRDAFDPRLRRR